MPFLSELWHTEYTGGTVEGLMWLLVQLHHNFERNGTYFCNTPESWVLGLFKFIDKRLCTRLSF